MPATSLKILPIYELYQDKKEELEYVKAHVGTKPFSHIIQTCWSLRDCSHRNGPIREHQTTETNNSSSSMQHHRQQKAFQDWLDALPPAQTHDIIEVAEALLNTAIYLGMDSSFCAFIIAEICYFIARKNMKTAARLYGIFDHSRSQKNGSSGEQDGQEVEAARSAHEAVHQYTGWKTFPKHPLLRQCLHKDKELQLLYKDDCRRDLRKGVYFIQTGHRKFDVDNAIEAGNLRFLALLKPRLHSKLTERAAAYAQIHILEWFKQHQCPFDGRAAEAAAAKGHLGTLIWLTTQKFPWSASNCAYVAAEEGHLEIVAWIREQGGSPEEAWRDTMDTLICLAAAENGHLNILKWSRDRGCQWDNATCSVAAQSGHLDVLIWLRDQHCHWDSWTCSGAAMNGHLEILKWARAQHCPWDELTCANAAKGGHLVILQWARENGCPWDEWTCAYAALGGYLDILKWARQQGCPWNVWTCAFAANSDHHELLKWARDQGCPDKINDEEWVQYL